MFERVQDIARELDLVGAYGPDEGLMRATEYDEAFAPGDAEAERLAQLPPGPELAASLAASEQLVMSAAARMKIYWTIRAPRRSAEMSEEFTPHCSVHTACSATSLSCSLALPVWAR